MDEPTTDSTNEFEVDEDWPAARGPHLPDALGILPGPAWFFVLLAAGRFAWALRDASFGNVLDPWLVGQVVLFVIPSVTVILLPAALLTRHPDAPTRGPTLFLGTVILAVVEGLRILNSPLRPFFEQLTPASQETPFLVPLDLVYGALIGLLELYAFGSIGLGLSQARRWADRSGTPMIVGALALAAILVGIARTILLSQSLAAEIPTTPTVVAYVASTGALGVLSAAVFGYLAATLARGARAGEEPLAGWRIGGAGASLVLVGFALEAVISFARPTPESQPLFANLGQVIAGISALGYLGLLGGFALGMPSPDDLDDDDPVNESEAD